MNRAFYYEFSARPGGAGARGPARPGPAGPLEV